MNLQNRIELLGRLGKYLLSGDAELENMILEACHQNPWFTPDFTRIAIRNIASSFLEESLLWEWVAQYPVEQTDPAKNVGIVMAGNIPLVGFHDMLCAFICGHRQTLKLSSKDAILPRHVVSKLIEWMPAAQGFFRIAEQIKNCDAYIATGSNQSARYFEHYFSKYPHIIRHNRTSVSCISGRETDEELERLADDIHLFFGMGCRNVTKLYVPESYDFGTMMAAMKKYEYFSHHSKYMSNYDYRLAILLLNRQSYHTNGHLLLTEAPSLFSPISVLHYEYVKNPDDPGLLNNEFGNIQCVIGKNFIPFGSAQVPSLTDYADGIDTMEFMCRLA